MAVRNNAMLPRIIFHGTRSLHSEIAGKGSEDVARRADGIAGGKFGALVSSSFPMPDGVQIMLEGNMAGTSGGSKERTNEANSTGPNVSSEDSTELGQKVAEALFVLFTLGSSVYVLILIGTSVYFHLEAQKEEMTKEEMTKEEMTLESIKNLKEYTRRLNENTRWLNENRRRIEEDMKRIQELNAPMSERTSSVASRMLLGSALTFGVTTIMFVIERYC